MSSLNATPEKIVFVTASTPFGSGEVFTLDEIVALKFRGCDSIIVPRSFGITAVHKQAEPLFDSTLNYKLIDLKTILVAIINLLTRPFLIVSLVEWCWRWSWQVSEFIKALAVLPKALRVADELKHHKFYCVHSTNTTTMVIIAYVISRIHNVPWSLTLHSWWPCFQKRKRHFETMIESACFCRVISVAACNNLRSLIDPLLHSKCFPVHIGADCIENSCVHLPQNNIFTIVTPANLEFHKGQHIAVEAGRILIERGINNYIWKFYGSGSKRRDLAKLIEKNGLSTMFEILGVISNSDLMMAYKEGSVHVVALPSIDATGMPEGIPHALIQAMGFGIPVISTNSGGTPELTGEGAGSIVPQNDPVALADAVQQLITNKEYFIDQTEKARQKVYDYFNYDKTCEQLKSLFMDLK